MSKTEKKRSKKKSEGEVDENTVTRKSAHEVWSKWASIAVSYGFSPKKTGGQVDTIEARIKEGYTVEQLIEAAEGQLAEKIEPPESGFRVYPA